MSAFSPPANLVTVPPALVAASATVASLDGALKRSGLSGDLGLQNNGAPAAWISGETTLADFFDDAAVDSSSMGVAERFFDMPLTPGADSSAFASRVPSPAMHKIVAKGIFSILSLLVVLSALLLDVGSGAA